MDELIFKDIDERLDLGLKRYGHGIRIHDNTIDFGTKTDSWLEMMEQELLDGIVYLTAHLMRKENIENDPENSKLRECLLKYKEEHIMMSHLFYMTRLCKKLQY